MKIAVIIVRVLMGLLFLFASITYLFHLYEKPQLTGTVKLFTEGLEATGYFMYTLKIFELICALSLLTNRYVPLFTVVLFPITLNIFLFHAFVDQATLPVAIFVLASNLFLAYHFRERYKPMLAAK
ncbi:MAG: DoxX family membrane protein [Bacteroidetes bacterium]|nr:DoxX family membrane protein [Bacteroidota bacterium]